MCALNTWTSGHGVEIAVAGIRSSVILPCQRPHSGSASHARASSAFSLIEILTALAILVVLAALAFPALMRSIEKARLAKDSSNLRQIGAGLLLFAGENQGRLPEAGGAVPWGTTSPKGLPSWTEQISIYLGNNRELFLSPIHKSRKQDPGYFLGTRPAMASGGAFGAVVLNRMEAPSETILAGTIGAPDMFTPGDWDPDDYTQSPAFDGDKNSRLKPFVNILFADGHVRACTTFDTNSMTTEYGRGRWYSF